MSNLETFFKTRYSRIFMTFVPAGVALGLLTLGVFLWRNNFPEEVLIISLVVSWLWLFTAIILIHRHIKRHFIGHFNEIAEYTNKLAQGKFPPHLALSQCEDDLYRDITSYINQIRDKLRATSTLNSVVMQYKKSQEQNHILDLDISIMNNIVQDLRRPLNIIAGYAYLMQKQQNSDESEYFKALNEAIRFAVLRVERLADVKSMVAATQSPQDFTVVNTVEFFSAIIDFIEKSVNYRQISLNVRFSHNLPQTLELDSANATQLIIIITRVLGLEVNQGSSIDIVISRRDNDIIYNVCDRDPKSNMASLPKVYSNYIDNPTTLNLDRDVELTTLGLFFIDAIAPYLNAQLDVSESEEHGTDLTLTLLDVVSSKQIAEKAHHNFSKSSQSDKHELYSYLKDKIEPHIAVVDYDENLAKIVQTLRPDAKVSWINGSKYFDMENIADMDLVIFTVITNSAVSINLERDYIHELQESHIPTVIILNSPATTLEQEFKENGADLILTYPVDYNILAKLIS